MVLTEAEVVAWRCDRHSHQVTVLQGVSSRGRKHVLYKAAYLVDGLDGGGHDDRKDLLAHLRLRSELRHVEEVQTPLGADGPVVVLARAIHSL